MSYSVLSFKLGISLDINKKYLQDYTNILEK